MIDAGRKEHGPIVTDYIKPYIDGDLDLVIATHPHADHCGGLVTVIRSFPVDRIIDSGASSSTVSFREFDLAAKIEPSCVNTSDYDTVIEMGNGAFLQIIDLADQDPDLNNNSVICMIDYKEVQILLPGDAENSLESGNEHRFKDVEILKAAHHGASNGFSMLDTVKPETVIISYGINTYGYPRFAMLQKFKSAGVKVYGTGKSGTIVVSTDGSSYQLNTATEMTLSDAGRAAFQAQMQ